MLVLSRKQNETIVIDGNIVIEVLNVKGKGVRLGIQAPSSVRVLRGELKPFEATTAAPLGGRVALAANRVSMQVPA